MKKVANSERSPAGLEWAIFRKIPHLAFFGCVLIAILRIAGRLAVSATDGFHAETSLRILDFVLLGLGVSMALLLTLTALGCAIVLIAKGPQYTADSYEVNDAESPS